MAQEVRRPGELPVAVLQPGIGVEHHVRIAKAPEEVQRIRTREQRLGMHQLVGRLTVQGDAPDAELLAIEHIEVEA